MIDANTISILLKITELGSYSKAAESLGYTHAGIRYIVQKAEEELGLKLFYRIRGGVVLTNEGQELLPWLRQMETNYLELDKKARELRDMNSGTIRVAAFTSVSVLWLPGMIKAFHSHYPGIGFEIINYEEDHKGRDMLRNGDVDCGIYVMPVENDLKTYLLDRVPLVAIVSLDHPLAQGDCFPFSELSNYPYVAGTGEEMIADMFTKNNVKLNVQFSANNDHAAMSLVSQGLGYCVVPESLAETTATPLVSLPLESPEYMDLVIAVRGNDPCTRSVQTFIDTAIKYVHNNSIRYAVPR